MSARLVLVAQTPTDAAFLEALAACGLDPRPITRLGELLDAASRYQPDLVVMGDHLDGGGGLEACGRLRRQELGAQLPIVLLSDRGDTAVLSQDIGIQEVLSTSFPPALLAARVKEVWGRIPAPQGATRLPAFGSPRPPRPVSTQADLLLSPDEDSESVSIPAFEDYHPNRFALLLLSRFQEGFTGRVEICGHRGRVSMDFLSGHPARVRGTGPVARPTLEDLVVETHLVPESLLRGVVAQAWRDGMHVRDLLLSQQILDELCLDALEREVVLRRMLAVPTLGAGSCRAWRETANGPLHPVHIAAVIWRLAGLESPVEPLPASVDTRFLVAGPELVAAWPHLDPDGSQVALKMLILGGARVHDATNLVGYHVPRLLGLLRLTGLVDVTEQPMDLRRRAELLARSDIEPFVRRLRIDQALLSDADPFTLEGAAPTVDPCEDLSARYHPQALPDGLSPADRLRANLLFLGARMGRHALSDPRRRAVIEALMASGSPPRGDLPDPDDHAFIQADQARDLLGRGEALAAAALLALAIQLEGEDPDVLVLLAQARRMASPGDPQVGEAELRRALALAPDHCEARHDLARLLAERGQMPLARGILRPALNLAPDREDLRRLEREMDRIV